MPPADPIVLTWCLRLKYHKATILLHVDPLQSLLALKQDIIEALQNVKSLPEDLSRRSLPISPSDIQLAKPRDMFDHSAGWERIDKDFIMPEELDELADDTVEIKGKGKGKGKAKSKANGNRKSTADEKSIKECGIKDNGVIAFRIAKADDDEDEGIADAMEEHDEWDVIIPTYEDVYGVENEGDLGQLKDYRG